MPASIRSASSDVKSRTSTRFIVVFCAEPPICMFQIDPPAPFFGARAVFAAAAGAADAGAVSAAPGAAGVRLFA